ncbi:Dynamin-like 120 kDa protein, putative isoform 1 [Theobroma cacao]|uniref:Dynamin-like 120 kDa protein, putative isoform 1 n=2 Tax=Theobroma cacao TaxID=3641 RepID=A0A061GB21_THECC|nr:Dynamin-like 120 kDa protein, putative isoform 1 [Theobroma cacao]
MESSISNSNDKIEVTNQRKGFEGIRMENPFTLKVGQVFTGFGIGCGIGIGVGRPINLGAIPMLGQVMSATRGATDAFSGVSRHVNGALRKLGAKNIEAGIGCGVGLGHGFGVGLAVKPGVVRQIQCCVIEAMTKLMMKFGMAPKLPFSEGSFPVSFQSSLTTRNEPYIQSPLGNMKQMVTKLPDPTSQGLPGPANVGRDSAYEKLSSKYPTETSYGSRTEKVLSSFLQNPVLKEDKTSLNELVGRLRSENNLLQLVLKHQRIIEELMEENQKLHQILIEDLKIPPSKLQASYSSKIKSPCSECFHCRRKLRKNR